MDIIELISKVQEFPDAEIDDPSRVYQSSNKYFADGPRLHEFLRGMRKEVVDKYGTITVGEMPYVYGEDQIPRVVHLETGSPNTIFTFEHTEVDSIPGESEWSLHKWKIQEVKRITNRLQRLMIEKDDWSSTSCETTITSSRSQKYEAFDFIAV